MLDLPYLTPKTAKGRRYLYYRRGGRWYPLPPIEDPGFKAAYDKIHLSFTLTKEAAVVGTVDWLIEEYKASADYKKKAAKTRKDYDRYLAIISDMWGKLPARGGVTRAAALAWRDALLEKPRTANYAMQVTRLLFNFGEDRGLVTDNPARRPKMLKAGKGHKPWPDAAIIKFIEANAEEDPMMVLALTIGLYTGLREGDAILLGKNHYDGQKFSTVAAKNEEPVWITALTPLREAIDPVMRVRFMLLVTKTGRPFKVDYFRHRFRAAVLRAGLDGLTFHGLRTTAATILAEWCTDAQLQAIFGWRDAKTPAHYRRLAEKKKLAAGGMAKWEQKLLTLRPQSRSEQSGAESVKPAADVG